MKSHNIFNIPFKTAKLGLHEYHFQVDDNFFANFEDSVVEKGKFDIKVNMDKKETMLDLEFEIKGSINNPCDRCLASIDVPVEAMERIVVKFDDFGKEDTDEVIYISTEETNLNVANLIYEFVSLSLPISNTIDCEANDYEFCDQKVLDYYDELEEQSEKLEEEEIEEQSKIWDALKDIKLN
ncbi:YceD family protein [Portibacter lacus]|uniref:DUF177 domain-containing protein n=1 Tax=Portibacter lacus TaxID=1099794 RepID=A0AA37SQH2_9BACT|nr:YceD family protein [Portibacter lacus]GLR16743.1 hypothetical protein GCM10007940_13580 [Portibacter lacus]